MVMTRAQKWQALGQHFQTPPKCDCCERYVKEKSSKPVLLGCDAMLCPDCWNEWYDSGETTPEKLKAHVLEKFGKLGGAGVDWQPFVETELNRGSEDES